MKDNRPVNLDILSIHLPLAAYASIIHRISGLMVFIGIAFLLWLFQVSLAGEESFNAIKDYGQLPLFKLLLWGTLSALAYHLIAGIKHLLLDAGIGESKEGAPIGAAITMVISLLLIAALGVWIW